MQHFFILLFLSTLSLLSSPKAQAISACQKALENQIKVSRVPLIKAVQLNNLKNLDALIKTKAHLKSDKNQGYTALLEAINTSPHHGVEASLKLIRAGTHLHSNTAHDRTILWKAIAANAPEEIVLELLQHQIPTNSIDDFGNNLFHLIATSNGYSKKVVNHLLKEEVDINLINSVGHSPLYTLIYSAHLGIIDINKAQKTLTSFLQAKASPNFTPAVIKNSFDASRNTLTNHILFLAILIEHQPTIELLLQYGSDPNVISTGGYGFLHLIASNKDLFKSRDTIFLLRKYGAKHDLTENKTGNTPLHIATRNSILIAIEALLQTGASTHIKNKHDLLPEEMIPKYLLGQEIREIFNAKKNID